MTGGAEAKPARRPPAWLPPAAAALLRAWSATWRVRSTVAPELDPARAPRTRRFVYLIWHRTMLLACPIYRELGICIGVSQHGDGEIGAKIAERFGFRTARGSSTRGAARLVRAMLEAALQGEGDLALTPDGPKGPARRTKPGALYLAGRLGWPVVPVVLDAAPRKELASWDRFIVPAPFARVGIAAGEPLEVEAGADDRRLEALCREVDARMEDAERRARAIVSGPRGEDGGPR